MVEDAGKHCGRSGDGYEYAEEPGDESILKIGGRVIL